MKITNRDMWQENQERERKKTKESNNNPLLLLICVDFENSCLILVMFCFALFFHCIKINKYSLEFFVLFGFGVLKICEKKYSNQTNVCLSLVDVCCWLSSAFVLFLF